MKNIYIRNDALTDYNHNFDGLVKIFNEYKFEQIHLDYALRHYFNWRKYEQFMFVLEKGGDPNLSAYNKFGYSIMGTILSNPSIDLKFVNKILPPCIVKGLNINDSPIRFKSAINTAHDRGRFNETSIEFLVILMKAGIQWNDDYHKERHSEYHRIKRTRCNKYCHSTIMETAKYHATNDGYYRDNCNPHIKKNYDNLFELLDKGVSHYNNKKERLAKLEQERLAKLEQERLAKLEQERLAKLEQERLAKIEQERLAKLEQERLAKIEQERLEKIEQERLAKLEQERLAKIEQERLEKIEQERLAKLEQERLAKLEQERLAKLEQERLAKLEQERLAKLEQERLAKLEQERLAKLEQERLAKLEQERSLDDAPDSIQNDDKEREALAYLRLAIQNMEYLHISGDIIPENMKETINNMIKQLLIKTGQTMPKDKLEKLIIPEEYKPFISYKDDIIAFWE